LSTISGMNLSDGEKLSVIREYYKPTDSDTTYAKYATAQSYGVSVPVYTNFINSIDADGNGNISETEAKIALDNTQLTNKQKALLFAMTSKTFTKSGGNPYMAGFTYDKIVWAN
jgi:hypothetical protein